MLTQHNGLWEAVVIFDQEVRLIDGKPTHVLDIEVVAQHFIARCEAELETIYQKSSEASLFKQGSEVLSDEYPKLTAEELIEAAQAMFSVMVHRAVAKEIDRRTQSFLARSSCSPLPE